MKKIILIIALLSIGLNLSYAQPAIEIIGGDTYDWGKVKAKQKLLRAEIKIKNSGDEVLDIIRIKPSCGCTTAPLSKNKLSPGETATMNVTLNTSGRTGNVKKSIRIQSNDPNNQHKILWIKADIFTPIITNPVYLNFSKMMVGFDAVAKVKIKNNSDQAITFKDFRANPENMIINLHGIKELQPGEEMELIARVKPEKQGNFNSLVYMSTSHPDHPRFIIKGFGRVKESPIFLDK